MDKGFWRAIRAQEFAVPEGASVTELLPELMAGLGSVDSELRDALCYEVLGTWIEQGRYGADTLRRIAAQMMANLKAGLGEDGGDGVFLRSFSVLILVEVVRHDASRRLMAEAEVRAILDAGLEYLAAERDLRGFVPEKGWAHSVAHTGDLMTVLAAHPALGEAELERLLAALRSKVRAQTQYPYIEREAFRLARAVIAAARRPELPIQRMQEWFSGFCTADYGRRQFVPGRDSVPYHNTESFLAAVHWMFTFKELPPDLRVELVGAVHQALAWYFPYDV